MDTVHGTSGTAIPEAAWHALVNRQRDDLRRQGFSRADALAELGERLRRIERILERPDAGVLTTCRPSLPNLFWEARREHASFLADGAAEVRCERILRALASVRAQEAVLLGHGAS